MTDLAVEPQSGPGGPAPRTARPSDRDRPRGGHRARKRTVRILTTIGLAIVSLLMAAPFLWMFLTSVRSPEELASTEMSLLPKTWEWGNYAEAMAQAPFAIYARNSFLLALAQTAASVTIGAACGYSLAKMRFKAAPWIFGGILASMMVPFYATVIPQFLMVRFMPFFGGNNALGQGGSGWIDTWWGLIVPGAISAFNIFLLRQFYVATPTELIEAARLDGVSELGIFARIVTPLIKPGLLTVALLSFEQGWNNFLWPLLVTSSEGLRVIQLGLSVFRQEAGTDFHLLMAGTTVAAVPMIILFAIFQRYFVNGFVSSGIK
ncbi:carbohydrate ABC transporter permease [Brachybacterium fresconis]|uniref:Multiple sugar transport system permease protein n=1 Tax=Brachybacterium fresconis TaxID=173363 RepID=A0ABS4YL08_9MICO|nr:carbohydrate ABC transporter permease [Brachybacterium fresconis]MBP2409175.1 multiple sugar transport system permease protein [Brachybacterium fresconis]